MMSLTARDASSSGDLLIAWFVCLSVCWSVCLCTFHDVINC